MPAISGMKIIIVGAGIGGLTMGILLERANISYEILEKHVCLNPLALFQQLGLLDEIKMLSKPFGTVVFREENLDIIGSYSCKTPVDTKERYGEYCQIISRRDLCTLLASQIPKRKIKFGKRVLEIRQNVGEVIVQCSDKSVHHADLLVGADGAYSAVRQCLYSDLSSKGLLPKQDTTPMGYLFDCLVGVTGPMDLHQNSALLDKFAEFQTILGKDSTHSSWCIPLTDNRVSWMVVKYHDRGRKYAEETLFKHSDWGADAAEMMSHEYRGLKTTYGCDMGCLMDATPKGSMTKVMLEEKIYKTWYSGRVVLTGDAIHKVLPFGGQGASQSIQDVLTLANMLVDLESNTVPDIENIFQEYQRIRAPICRSILQMSNRFGHLMNRKPSYMRLGGWFG
ncbi:hypothetical protein BGX27_010018 [Mortierella sp. AM989]|nr:hypothetical protein BGX27_010018 [Mortierella sp. AM989]